MFAVAQPKRDHGQRGYAAPIELREPEALSDPDAYAPGGTGSRHSAITTSTSGLSSIAATCSAVVSMCRHASAILMNAERYLLGTSNAIASLSIGFGFRRRRPRFAARSTKVCEDFTQGWSADSPALRLVCPLLCDFATLTRSNAPER